MTFKRRYAFFIRVYLKTPNDIHKTDPPAGSCRKSWTGKRTNKKWLRRYRIKKEKIEAGIPIRTRGQHRKNSEPKNIIAEQVYEIQRLKMENDLLRDFLRFAERR